MMGPLFETKLHVPTPRPRLVVRPRLGERLSHATEVALTLVSAPAGFGKATLLTQWLAAADGPATAWLSLDQRHNDAAVFWTTLSPRSRRWRTGLVPPRLGPCSNPRHRSKRSWRRC